MLNLKVVSIIWGNTYILVCILSYTSQDLILDYSMKISIPVKSEEYIRKFFETYGECRKPFSSLYSLLLE